MRSEENKEEDEEDKKYKVEEMWKRRSEVRKEGGCRRVKLQKGVKYDLIYRNKKRKKGCKTVTMNVRD